jgi:predicted DNA-binding protein (UPF0278 family)
MPGKKDLASMLGAETAHPKIRRGAGVRLSTEVTAHSPSETAPETRTSATSHKRTNASKAPKRVNRGYKLREDLIKDCRRIALEEDQALYEVMEEALAEYIERYRAKEKKASHDR